MPNQKLLCYSTPSMGAGYCDDHVCLSVCMSLHLSLHLHISETTHLNFARFSVRAASGYGSVLLSAALQYGAHFWPNAQQSTTGSGSPAYNPNSIPNPNNPNQI